MNDSAIRNVIREKNPWWRDAGAWEADDPYLRELADAPYSYEPRILEDIEPPGLYVLTGPRRVGKSAEMRRTIRRLIHHGVEPRRIIYGSCDSFSQQDLRRFFVVGRALARSIEGPLYWLVDEVTAIGARWSEVVKDLRDDSPLRQDCVVLTGSSARGLEDATKNLAGRRGDVADSSRLLLPMTFRSFATVTKVRGLPTADPLRPKDMRTAAAQELFDELYYFVDGLNAAWADYLRAGGYPRAVTDLLNHGDVSQGFQDALWDVVLGESRRNDGPGAPDVLGLLNRLAVGMASPVNLSKMTEDLGVGSHNTVEGRIENLVTGYQAWRCYRSDKGKPKLSAQRKVYFTDPLLARLAALRNNAYREPDETKLAEQQIGLALVRALGQANPGSLVQARGVLYERTRTDNEIDFVGPDLEIAFEVKYGQSHWRQEARTVEANYEQSIMATDDIYDTEHPAWAVPASMLAWALD